MTGIPTLPNECDGFIHSGLFHGSDEEYRTAVGDFVHAGLALGEPVLVAVPGPRVDLLRDGLDGQANRVAFTDMTELGRNPARIIPTVRRFVDNHPDQRVRFVGEPIWPTRTAAETRAATRHEALINRAFADTRATILCPYDTTRLDGAVLADAERTHPVLLRRGEQQTSPAYTGPDVLPSSCDQPLPPQPDGADKLTILTSADLAHVRSLVTDHATQAQLPADRIADLVFAVGEVATNTLRHTDGTGTLYIWQTGDRLLCQVQDGGHITDPLAGRRPSEPETPGGHGLWLVNQLCDLVELRSHKAGTTVRMHLQTRP